MIFHGFGVSTLAGRPEDCRQRGPPQFGHYFFTSRTKPVFRQKCQRHELLIAIGEIKHSLKRNATGAPIYPWLWTSVTRPEGSKCGTEAGKKMPLQVWNRQKRCKNGGSPRDGRKHGQRPAGGERARLHAGNSHPVEEPRVAPPHSNHGH